MKKILSIFLGLALTVQSWAYDFKSGDLCYKITSKNTPLTVEVSRESEGKDNYSQLTNVVVPETVTNDGKTYKVTGIGRGAFNGASSMTSITMPKTITRIDHYAFESCSSLPSITIPSGVERIGYQLFCHTDKLKELIYEAVNCVNVGSLDHSMLEGNESITTVRIVEGVKYLPNGLLTSGKELVNVSIANSVESINGGFITFASKGNSYGEKLKFNEYNNALYLGNEQNPYIVLAKAKSKNITNCNVHQQAKTIICHAFEDCANLTEVNIPNTLSTIGQSAFKNCSSLKHVTLPDNLQKIEANCFFKCDNLESVTFSGTSKVAEIHDDAFQYCEKLKSIEFPNSLKLIAQHAVANCSNLESVKFGNKLEEIQAWAFADCPKLKTVTVPKSAKTLIAPFQPGCTSLQSINVEAGSKNFASVEGILFNFNKTILISYPAARVGSSYTVPKTVKEFGFGAFAGSQLSEIKMQSGIEMSFNTFEQCKNLKSIVIPEGTKDIMNLMFAECENLESITLPKSLKSVRDQAFRNCKKLKNIYISDTEGWFKSSASFTSLPVGYNLYVNGTLLTDLKVPEGADRIRNTFKGCSSIKTITIPASVTYIDPDAFAYMSGLTQFNVNSGNKNYCAVDGVLFKADKETLVKVPQAKTGDYTITIRQLEDYALEGCQSLNSIKYGSLWTKNHSLENARVRTYYRIDSDGTLRHTYTVKSSDESKGEAYIALNSPDNEIVAEPKAGYEFVRWSDNTTKARREIGWSDSDFDLTAVFKKVGEADPVISAPTTNSNSSSSSSSKSDSKKDNKKDSKKETKATTPAATTTSTPTATANTSAASANTQTEEAKPVSKTKIKKKKK